jgi:signal peptidase I
MTGFTMHPALQDGDCVFVSQMYYLKHQPRRGDLVLLKSPENPDYWYIRRIVALGGEQLKIRGTHIIINGKEIKKSWNIYTDQGEPQGLDNLPSYEVPKDSVFLLGDNADFSIDSRSFGAIPKGDLKGKVMVIYWSAALNKVGREL